METGRRPQEKHVYPAMWEAFSAGTSRGRVTTTLVNTLVLKKSFYKHRQELPEAPTYAGETGGGGKDRDARRHWKRSRWWSAERDRE